MMSSSLTFVVFPRTWQFSMFHFVELFVESPPLVLHCPSNAAIISFVSRLVLILCSLTVSLCFTSTFSCFVFVAISLSFSTCAIPSLPPSRILASFSLLLFQSANLLHFLCRHYFIMDSSPLLFRHRFFFSESSSPFPSHRFLSPFLCRLRFFAISSSPFPRFDFLVAILLPSFFFVHIVSLFFCVASSLSLFCHHSFLAMLSSLVLSRDFLFFFSSSSSFSRNFSSLFLCNHTFIVVYLSSSIRN